MRPPAPYLDTEAAASLPRPALDLDRPALAAFLRRHCPALFPLPPQSAAAANGGAPGDPLFLPDVGQFGHGQSNPTYLVTDRRTGARVVLRKQPPGVLLDSAHAVDREFRLLSALRRAAAAGGGAAPVPVPAPLAFSRDGAGLDGSSSSSSSAAQFYVMSFAPGRIYLDPRMPGESPRRRARAYAAMADTLAALHSVDPRAVGLLGGNGNGNGGNGAEPPPFGNPRGYCARQVERWARQYAASGGSDPGVARLVEWLRANAPRPAPAAAAACASGDHGGAEPEEEGAIVHGDFRLDNLVFDPAWALDRDEEAPLTTSAAGYGGAPHSSSPSSSPSSASAAAPVPAAPVAAVLDWELATLGDPWSDVAYMCLPYRLPKGALPAISLGGGGGGQDGALPEGVPTEAELLARYCRARAAAAAARGSGGVGGGVGGGGHDSQQQRQQQQQIRPPSPRRWAFYVALSAFRLLAILEGVRARARAGNASSAAATALASDAALAALLGAAEAAIASSSSSSSSPPSDDDPLLVRPTVARPSPRAAELLARVRAFVEERVVPAEPVLNAHAHSSPGSSPGSGGDGARGGAGVGGGRWTIHPLQEELKREAKALGLWNLWIPEGMARECVGPFLDRLLAEGSGGGKGPPSSSSSSPSSPPLSPEEARLLRGPGLSNADYAHLCEAMGRSVWAPECFNCSAPDTGNMEVLARYGSHQQQKRWLLPLLRGEIRSCFAMTERPVASSDATNIQARIERVPGGGVGGVGDGLRLTGVKWWTSGAMDPRCAVAIFMGRGPGVKGAGGGGGGGGAAASSASSSSILPSSNTPSITNPNNNLHSRQSMVLVPLPSAGVRIVRPLTVYGYDDAPHGHAEVEFTGCLVDETQSLILGAGRGFEIAQGRLGPGRLHHCMRLIGAGERALKCWRDRARARVAFGGPLSALGGLRADFARRRVQLDAARLLVLDAAAALDALGHKRARGQIAAAKVAAPAAALAALDGAVQAHGGAGVSGDFPLAALWAAARTLRIADGPDEVHLESLAKLELGGVARPRARL